MFNNTDPRWKGEIVRPTTPPDEFKSGRVQIYKSSCNRVKYYFGTMQSGFKDISIDWLDG